VDQLVARTGAAALFPKMPTIYFYPQIRECPMCGAQLKVQKSRPKTVITMHIGAFDANETVLYCPNDQTIFASEQLRSLVPKAGNFGFDVIVEVGMALFVHCHNHRQIMEALAARHVTISERQISYLGRKFIVYLAIAHRQCQSRLRALMARRGGYILHVDGTCEGDSPNLFCGLDGISELVLDTVKIPSEKKERLVPFFRRIKEQYGDPKALVHDMGRGIGMAVQEVFPKVADFICHFHFLRDVGKDLLLDEYSALQKRLQRLNVRSLLRQKGRYLEQKIDPTAQALDEIVSSLESGTWQTTACEPVPLIMAYALIKWVFAYPQQSNGYGFPFDRSHLDFFRRLQTTHRLLEQIMEVRLRGIVKDNKPYCIVYRTLTEAVNDKRLNDLAASLERKAKVFDKLRSAMRIALPDGKDGINDNGENADIKSIEEKVTDFRKWLIGDDQRKATYAKMLKQIDKYWQKLFADPLPVVTPDGVVYIQPQRTNNILERMFREEKRRIRKKNGTASLSKVLKAMLAETPLVQNLRNSEYMDAVLDGCSTLAERLSRIDASLVKKEMEAARNNREKILPSVKKMSEDGDLTKKISALFSSKAK
jgi:hypothetical protein